MPCKNKQVREASQSHFPNQSTLTITMFYLFESQPEIFEFVICISFESGYTKLLAVFKFNCMNLVDIYFYYPNSQIECHLLVLRENLNDY